MVPDKTKIEEILKVAKLMLENSIDLIEGCRILSDKAFDAGVREDDLFSPIIAIESETDTFPIGEVRAKCSLSYLAKMDAAKEDFISDAERDIHNYCREIIAKYSGHRPPS